MHVLIATHHTNLGPMMPNGKGAVRTNFGFALHAAEKLIETLAKNSKPSLTKTIAHHLSIVKLGDNGMQSIGRVLDQVLGVRVQTMPMLI